ncbi:ankyrin repeat domain-containing protein [Wielerella bovis]|nr:ankyrin repeat domain-containing protein [Wielerella bovis]ULJ61506.1 ankyrin repeat domain-containing protein [Wielerella bovis]
MLEKWREHLQQNADLPTESNERSYTLLHTEAIAGNAPLVALLLEHGADPTAQTDEGYTAAHFARHLQWQNVLVTLGEVADLH